MFNQTPRTGISIMCAHYFYSDEEGSNMPWIISNGKSYVEIIGNNQMITTAYIDRAHTFNNKKTAEKYCSLLPKAMKNLKYKVIFISNPNPENPDLQLELLTPEFYLTRLKNFSDFIHTIQCQRETLVTGQRKAELEIEDIEHAAEFYNLDASHGYQLYKLLHDARVRRRKCKNAIAWIDYILEQAPDRFIENDPSPRIAGTRSRDDFCTGNSNDIKVAAVLREVRQKLDQAFHLNVRDILDEACRATRADMTTAEKNQFYDKYIKTMHVDISPNGEATIVLGN